LRAKSPARGLGAPDQCDQHKEAGGPSQGECLAANTITPAVASPWAMNRLGGTAMNQVV
jgi:hypothetical protein